MIRFSIFTSFHLFQGAERLLGDCNFQGGRPLVQPVRNQEAGLSCPRTVEGRKGSDLVWSEAFLR